MENFICERLIRLLYYLPMEKMVLLWIIAWWISAFSTPCLFILIMSWALIIASIQCLIEEYKTGERREQVPYQIGFMLFMLFGFAIWCIWLSKWFL